MTNFSSKWIFSHSTWYKSPRSRQYNWRTFFESNECNDDFATPKAHSLEAISRPRQATAVSTVRASLERKDKTILFAYRLEQ